MQLTDLLEEMIEKGSGDLHLQPGRPPCLRLGGDITPIREENLTDAQVREWMRQMAFEGAQIRLDETGESDFAFEMPGKARWRVNAYKQRGALTMALRMIPMQIPAFGDLNLPHVLEEIAQKMSAARIAGHSPTVAAARAIAHPAWIW